MEIITPDPIVYASGEVYTYSVGGSANNYIAVESEEQTPEPEMEQGSSGICEDYTQKYCSCILYLQERGLNIRGNAVDLVPNTDRPFVGGVVIFHYPSGVAHASYIEIVFPSGNFRVSEWNYREGQYTERNIFKDDKNIYGYMYVNPN